MSWLARLRGQANAPHASQARIEPVIQSEQPTTRKRRHAAHASYARSLSDLAAGNRTSRNAWRSPLSAHEIVNRHHRLSVAISRELALTSDHQKQLLRQVVNNVIGHSGIALSAQVPTADGSLDHALNEAIEWAWDDFTAVADVTRRRNLRGLLKSVMRTTARDGEYLIRIVEDDNPFGFALQSIDPQRLPIDHSVQLAGGAYIEQGIEFNAHGRPVAYWIDNGKGVSGTRQLVRVPASEILHDFIEEFEGQRRGLPWSTASAEKLRNINAMEEAAIIKARVGANAVGFIEWEEGTGPDLEEDDDLVIDSEAGEWKVLPAGARAKDPANLYPQGEYAPFVKIGQRGIAAGWGVPYHAMTGDLEGVNYSSIRQGELAARDNWKDLQQWLIEGLLQKLAQTWLPRALLAGQIRVNGRTVPAHRAREIQRHLHWQPRRWAWVDPLKDGQSEVLRKNNHLDAPSNLIRESGRDPFEVWKASARDVRQMIDAFRKEGLSEQLAEELVLVSMGKAPNQKIEANPSNQAKQGESPTKGDDDDD